MKKRFLIGVLIVLLFVFAAACGSSTGSEPAVTGEQEFVELSEDQEVTLKYYNYNLAYAGLGQEGTQQLIDEFMEMNPNITIEGVAVTAPEIMQRTRDDTVAGDPPDIAQLIFDDLAFIVEGLNAPALEDIIPADQLDEHLGGMHPRGVALGQFNGKTYGLAYTFSTPMVYYNKDLFREAGLDPENPPETWEEIKEASLQIVENTGKEGVFPAVYGQFDWIAQAMIKSNGGEVLSDDRSTIMFGEPEAVEAIAMLRDLVQSGAHTKLSSGDAGSAFNTGDLGMYMNSSAVQARLIPAVEGVFELGAFKMPSYGTNTPAPTNSGSAIFILSDDPVKQAAAWEFMKFVTSKRGYTVITSKIGYLPLRTEIVNEEEYLKEWAEENPFVFDNLEQLDNLAQWESYPGQDYKQIANILMTAIDEAVYGDSDDVAAIMQDAASRAQELVPTP